MSSDIYPGTTIISSYISVVTTTQNVTQTATQTQTVITTTVSPTSIVSTVVSSYVATQTVTTVSPTSIISTVTYTTFNGMVYETLRKSLTVADKFQRNSVCYIHNYYNGSNLSRRNYYGPGDVRALKSRTKLIRLMRFRITATTNIVSSYVSTILSTLTYTTYSGTVRANPVVAEQFLTKATGTAFVTLTTTTAIPTTCVEV
jgi:hypothetical protein